MPVYNNSNPMFNFSETTMVSIKPPLHKIPALYLMESFIRLELVIPTVKEKVDDSMFLVSSDYKSMTPEEMQKMYGGGQ